MKMVVMGEGVPIGLAPGTERRQRRVIGAKPVDEAGANAAEVWRFTGSARTCPPACRRAVLPDA